MGKKIIYFKIREGKIREGKKTKGDYFMPILALLDRLLSYQMPSQVTRGPSQVARSGNVVTNLATEAVSL